jgi:hypothetical protein
MYVFILQCQKVQNFYKLLLKRPETYVIVIIFIGVVYHVRT